MRAIPRLLVAGAAVASLAASLPAVQARTNLQGLIGGITFHTTTRGETLGTIGARYGIDAATLAADNARQPGATLAVGAVLRIDNRHLVPAAVTPGSLVVNVPQRMLFYRLGDGTTVGFPVAVGLPSWRTPLRPFTVVTKEIDPTWEVPVSIQEEALQKGRQLPAVVPPGPDNPLGRFWLGLSIPSVGIHGTNAPSSIYRVTTHGCIRVGPDDIAWLYPRVELGTPGEIVYEPVLLAAVGETVYLEVHRDVYGRLGGDPRPLVRASARLAGIEEDISWPEADAAIAARHGIARIVGMRKNPRLTGVISH